MYSHFYRLIQEFIILILGTNKNFKKELGQFISYSKIKEIHDIGGSDGELLNYLNLKNKKYYCYDIDLININKAKQKYQSDKNIKFLNQSIDKIKINKYKRKLFVLSGVFHHLNDLQIQNFLSRLSNKHSVIAIDPFFHKNQNIFGYILKRLDRGKYIRNLEAYKSVLKKFKFKKKIKKYLKFYSHLISYRNIEPRLIEKFFDY
tara:strand:+ start:187 stop:798 length:612 start_codon:yes stop_codon:yes gene_type:complete